MTCSVAMADSDVPPTSCARVGSSSMGRRPAPGRRGWPLLLAPLLVLQGCDMVGQIESTVEAATTGAGMQAASSASSAPSGVPSAASNAPEASVSKTSLRLSEQGIPLSVGSWFGGPRLVVEVAPAGSGGWLPKQRLVLDSGSSTLAFCDSQFSQQAQYQSSDFISCNLYNPGGDFTGYWGPFVKGAVKVGNFTIPKAAYSIMQQEKSMPCTDGLDGIFGIAFRQLDRAFRASDEYEMELSPEGKFTCPNQPAGVVPPPLVQHLRSTESAKIGLYWSGQQGEAQGRLYLGQSAVENEHYALADPLPAAHLGELGWYDISVQSITVGEQELEGLNCDPVHGETCILDTGTPAIVLPPEAYELVESSSGSLSFQLAGPNGPTTLSFDLQQLSNMGAISKGNKGDGLILGLPLWAFYYTVFDLDAHQVIFVPAYPPPSDPEVYPTEGPVWQPEPIQPTEPVIPFPGGGPWRPIPGGAGDIVGGPFGWPMGIFKENVTEPVQKGRVEESKAGGHRMLRGTVHI